MSFDSVSIKNKIEELFNEPYGKPTDVIGFKKEGPDIANTITPIIGRKEICFFDQDIKEDPVFHYLDFVDMLEKSEIMIFTIELPKEYYKNLTNLNKKVKIFLPKEFSKTISMLRKKGYGDNLVLL